METVDQWLNRIGTKEAMEERHALRAAGKLNRPIKGVHGIRDIVHSMIYGKKHPLTCRCDECIPPWLKEEMKSWPVVKPGQYEARKTPQRAKPVTVIKSQSTEPKRQRKNWQSRGNSGN